jgi:putative methyltransferase (TIGR04325 family)
MDIKDYIPPVLIRLLKRSLLQESNKQYKDYPEALKNCTPDGYENVELCNMIADKTVIHSGILKEKPFNLIPANIFLLSAVNQSVLKLSERHLTVLDFGGACGAHYFEVRRLLSTDFSLKWFVVETEQMVKSAKNRGLNNNELEFISSIDEVKTPIDLIYTSCALHYVPDPYECINLLIQKRAGHILFNRMMFNENDKDFVTIQKSFLSANGPGKLPEGYSDRILSYPHTTLSFKKFNNLIISNGYKMEWIFDELSGSYQIKNEKITGKGVMYVLNA